MDFLILILAVAGGLAVLARAGRALFRLAYGGAEALLAGEVVSSRARQGDVTGLQDAASARVLAVRRRRLALATLAVWAGLLLLPVLTPWPAAIFACYSVLWLYPRRRSARP